MSVITLEHLDMVLSAIVDYIKNGPSTSIGDLDEPMKAEAGLYETGTNYGTMIASWDELVESGKIVVTDGVVSRGMVLPDNTPEKNEYGFYFNVMYTCHDRYSRDAIIFHEDGSLETYVQGVLQQSHPVGSSVYGDKYADLSSVGMSNAVFSDEMSFVLDGYVYTIKVNASLDGHLVLPSNETIVTIANEAFSNDADLAAISVSNSVTAIETGAFVNCRRLSSVSFGDNSKLTTIGEEAFAGCLSLVDMEIPSAVTSINWHAFNECGSLKVVTVLAETPPALDDYAFDGCNRLATIKVPASSVDAYKSASGWSNYADKIVAIGEADNGAEPAIAAGLYTDNTYSTMTTSWQDLLNAGVVHVDDGVVYTDADFREFTNGSADSLIGVLVLPDDGSVTALGDFRYEDEGNTLLGHAAFACCDGLTGIVIPETVTIIGAEAFDGCTGLIEINIPSSVTSIGDFAFCECVGLTSVEIPDSVVSIGESAFGGCTGVESVIFGENSRLTSLAGFENCSAITHIAIPDTVNYIGNSAFYGCTGLTEIEIPDAVTYIAGAAFYECTGLTEIEIPDAVTHIGDDAFSGCENLKNVTVLAETPPVFIERTGAYGFNGCYALTSIKVPASSVDAYKAARYWSNYANIIVAI